MFLQHLSLRHFRNYERAEVSFCPSVNILYGDNGQGKTNLLEAIHLISTGRSFRTKQLGDLIQAGASYFYIEAHFTKDGIQQSLKIFYDDKTRKVQYNNTAYTHLTAVLGILPGIVLSPEDHALISGSPSERRRFVDMYIAQIDPLYIHHLARYFRAMKQRNHLLKSRSETTLAAWEQAMAPSAAYLIDKRQTAISALLPPIAHWMETLSLGKDTLRIDYDSSISLQKTDMTQSLLSQWSKNRPKEMQWGSTLFGPHRDDLAISISDKDAKHFSSEGQKRCASAALRFAQWEQCYAMTGEKPLLSIDDFGIQLDQQRQELLQSKLSAFGQVFLTTPACLNLEQSHTIRVQNGHLEY